MNLEKRKKILEIKKHLRKYGFKEKTVKEIIECSGLEAEEKLKKLDNYFIEENFCRTQIISIISTLPTVLFLNPNIFKEKINYLK